MRLFVGNNKPLVEMPGIIEITCNGLARIEFMGNGLACFVLYRNALNPAAEVRERHACARIYAPLSTAPDAAELLTRAAAEAGVIGTARFPRQRLM